MHAVFFVLAAHRSFCAELHLRDCFTSYPVKSSCIEIVPLQTSSWVRCVQSMHVYQRLIEVQVPYSTIHHCLVVMVSRPSRALCSSNRAASMVI